MGSVNYEIVVETSSAKAHMIVNRVKVDRSTQDGTQFDLPCHFIDSPEMLPLSDLRGKAVVIDLRQLSDDKAITQEVVESALSRAFSLEGENFEVNLPAYQRVLLRMLDDVSANCTVPLREFPYFVDQSAVEALTNVIKINTGMDVRVLCVESPSVDEVNQGHLVRPDQDGLGGAHGALHERKIWIGENWDFRNMTNGRVGNLEIDFNHLLAGSPDSLLVNAAFLMPLSE